MGQIARHPSVPDPVTRAANGVDQLAVEGPVHLGAEAGDMRFDHIRLRIEAEVPDPFEEHRSRLHPALAAQKKLQQREFAGQEVYGLTGPCHLAGDEVHRQVPRMKLGFGDGERGAAGQDIDPIPMDEFGMPTYDKKKGRSVHAMNVRPELMWYNHTWEKMAIGVNDTYTVEPVVLFDAPRCSGRVDKDDPDSKLYPFKKMIGRQPADTVNKRMIVPHLFGMAGGANPYWAKFDWDLAMAEGALRASGADIAVSVTGIAGPTGGTPEKPVGTAWIGLARKGAEPAAFKVFHPRNRHDFKLAVSQAALDAVRRVL